MPDKMEGLAENEALIMLPDRLTISPDTAHSSLSNYLSNRTLESLKARPSPHAGQHLFSIARSC